MSDPKIDQNLLKLKMKKFFAQYEYLDSELSETKYLFDIYNKDFLKECNENTETDPEPKDPEINIVEPNINTEIAKSVTEEQGNTDPEEPTEPTEPAELEEPEEPGLKKLYRMLSLKTHPDKNGGDQSLFIEVKQAYHDKNIFKLIIIATKLNVDISCVSDAIELFEKSISEMQEKISNFKKTIAWNWAHADDVKKQRIREYIKKN
jgi:hypothetical protein